MSIVILFVYVLAVFSPLVVGGFSYLECSYRTGDKGLSLKQAQWVLPLWLVTLAAPVGIGMLLLSLSDSFDSWGIWSLNVLADVVSLILMIFAIANDYPKASSSIQAEPSTGARA